MKSRSDEKQKRSDGRWRARAAYETGRDEVEEEGDSKGEGSLLLSAGARGRSDGTLAAAVVQTSKTVLEYEASESSRILIMSSALA